MYESVRASAATGGAAKALQWWSKHILSPHVDVSSASADCDMEAQPEPSNSRRMLVAVRAAYSYSVPLIQRAVSPPPVPSLRIDDKTLGYASCHAHISRETPLVSVGLEVSGELGRMPLHEERSAQVLVGRIASSARRFAYTSS